MGGPTGPHQEVGAGIVGGTGEPVTVNSKTKLSWWWKQILESKKTAWETLHLDAFHASSLSGQDNVTADKG